MFSAGDNEAYALVGGRAKNFVATLRCSNLGKRVGQITYRLRSAAKLLSKDGVRPFFLIDINFKAERALYFEAPDALLVVTG